eukprot:CAMPEP_0168289564 /NCGR_PEP_ID=MMETSP0142_2-20121227/4473_1 /TAXON_ID=44445 /ORGANISM="Pseudo-nitzschia australis, Strain 10249 10 AB" /LENGTH=65 /DNA_ID=CAMNT_0008236205 /DNA_START=31 /DNA_END=228 /DNA_ORIENTATION=-
MALVLVLVVVAQLSGRQQARRWMILFEFLVGEWGSLLFLGSASAPLSWRNDDSADADGNEVWIGD